jgi:hypothetical protein
MQEQVLNNEQARDSLPRPELSEAEKAYLRIQDNFEQEAKPNYKMSQKEKIAIFQDLRSRIQDGGDANDIALSCVQMMEEYMLEKQEVAKSPTKNGPVFRRVT